MIESLVKLIDRMGAESVANFWPVERNTHCADTNSTVIGDIGEFEASNFGPFGRIENGGYLGFAHGPNRTLIPLGR